MRIAAQFDFVSVLLTSFQGRLPHIPLAPVQLDNREVLLAAVTAAVMVEGLKKHRVHEALGAVRVFSLNVTGR